MMEFALFAVSIYATVVTAFYLKQERTLSNAFDKVMEMQRVINASEPYIKKLTSEVEARKEELRIERSINKAQSETLRRLQETLSPASFDITDDEVKSYDTQDYRVADNENPVKHASEELAASFR
jgi:hypothetical protein